MSEIIRIEIGAACMLRTGTGAVVYDSRVPLSPEDEAALSALFAEVMSGQRRIVYDAASDVVRLDPPLERSPSCLDGHGC